MTTTLRSKIHVELAWTWRDHVDQLPIVDANYLRFLDDLADGNAAGQADAVWHATDQTLVADLSTTYRLDDLPQQLFGATVSIAMDKIKALLVVNKTTAATGYLLLGGAATNAWEEPFGGSGHTLRVMPESPILLTSARDGWDVTAASNALKITAIGGGATFDVAVLGTLAPLAGGSSSSSSA